MKLLKLRGLKLLNPRLADLLISLGTHREWAGLVEYVKEEIELIEERILTPGVDPLETEIGRIKRTIWLEVIALPRTAAEEKEEQDEPGT